ncbi:pleiotropic drug resistance protein 2-like [Humulus lupulus]|uniref:pleiotropic drug resistance protein 2-like n=1 Tax=Humulus lupulus TaxID=3486 RepID=UPI002B4098A5|nr:pleiotropic drug resistance protein 2-like [Humulus lupulus]
MAAVTSAVGGDEDGRLGSTSSRRSWQSGGSFREVWTTPPDVFSRSVRRNEPDDEEELRWAAIQRIPTFERMRKGVMKQVLENGRIVHNEIDFTKLGGLEKKQIVETVLKIVEEDNEKFLRRLRDRTDRAGIEIPKIEIRYENLNIEGDVYIGTRALPTLLYCTLNTIESILGSVGLFPSKKTKIQILKDVSGRVKPSRMTLLLGPPGAGKTTLLLALAGKLDQDLRVSGKVTYCGHEMNEFIPQRTCAYISQHDLHYGEMTVRETLDFSGRCLGVGTKYETLAELSRREKAAGIKPDPEIDAFMKATAISGQKTSLVTDYVLKILGLDMCGDILVGDDMRRGISGGQKKRLTIGEMLVGPAKVLLMDEISTGLDSATAFQICNYMRQMVHISDVTMVVSLLQPAPETFELFDDIIILSEGQIVYQGPKENVLEFFEYMGFKCPERKGVADFLQEVTSMKDQEQYWSNKDRPYTFIPVNDFVKGFKSFHIGQQLQAELSVPYDKSRAHPAALVKEKYGISTMELLKACFSREWLLMKRNAFVYVFKGTQITIMSLIAMTVFLKTKMHVGTLEDGNKYFGALFFGLINVMFNGMAEMALTIFKLPVFFKQRDFLFYPAWAFGLPICVLKVPLSFMESGIWVVLTYYTIGFAPAASRFFKQFLAYFCLHQMALSLFRLMAAMGRTLVLATMEGTFIMLMILVLGGFVISRNDIEPWLLWGYYASPLMYAQNAIFMNEFLDERWNTPVGKSTVGKYLLESKGFFTDEYWFWICIGALVGFSFLFNILFIAALAFLNPIGDSKAVIADEESVKKKKNSASRQQTFEDLEMPEKGSSETIRNSVRAQRRGMVLPFQPLSLAFSHVNYYVDMPTEMKRHGVEEDRLQLLRDVSGAFRPGILTALVGVTGAGKTTLLDVLAGRKTGGYIEGNISISGYPKNQSTFTRISGYCEQNDIHSPYVTVFESLIYSAWLRLPPNVKAKTRSMFVEEVMELVELTPIRDAIVGLPGVDGLSTEQRKRLTIAVELVANPSIIFMDEPTSGLDARAAAIVMRTVRNTVDTGRTVVCTIHQPSIDIFEAFDELILMKLGGQVIYAGSLGRHSNKLIEYFEEIPGVSKIKDGNNPATWMLEVTNQFVEAQLEVDFAEVYIKSSLYQNNEELIKELSTPAPESKDLYFSTKYSQSFFVQCKACLWKQYWSYWRNPQYNGIRFFMTIIIGILFGLIFWNKGQKTTTYQDLMTLLGALFTAVFFLGASNASSVQPVVDIERTVFYRERAAGMYSALPYAISQVTIEIIYSAIQAFVYMLILYAMIGFEWRADKVWWFFYYIFTCLVYFTLYGMMAVALTPGHQIGAIFLYFFFSFWVLFCGFLIPRKQIPIWWRWYYWASPVSWTIHGLISSQLGDKDSKMDIPGFDISFPLKDFIKERLDFDYDFLPFVAVAHIGWALLFLFVYAYGIKFINFQKR